MIGKNLQYTPEMDQYKLLVPVWTKQARYLEAKALISTQSLAGLCLSS